jgi:hypothetical protein
VVFAPDGYLATGDVLLAQKISLETMEREALALANSQRPSCVGPEILNRLSLLIIPAPSEIIPFAAAAVPAPFASRPRILPRAKFRECPCS